MRGIGPIRISRLDDDTTSPPRQRRHIDTKADAERIDIIAYPEDLDISASKYSPFERPKLGPWMTEPDKLAQYDALVFWRVDRFVRNGQDFRDVLTWAQKHKKKVFSATEAIQYDPDADGIDKIISELLMTVVVAFAEIESTNLAIRVNDTMDYLRESKRPLNGSMPFGTKPGVDANGNRTWVKSEETTPIVYEIVTRLRSGEKRLPIAQDLNERGVLSPKDWTRKFYGKAPKGTRWNDTTISAMFATDSLLGYQVLRDVDGKMRTARDTVTGEPIKLCDPVLATADGSPDVATLREVQRLLDAPYRRMPSSEATANPLHEVVKCYDCGRNLNGSTRKVNGRIYQYVLCKKGHRGECPNKGMIAVDVAWDYLESLFLGQYEDDPVIERTYVQRSDHSRELDELRTAFDAVSKSLESATSDMLIQRQTARLDQLAARIASLESEPTEPGGWVETQLGVTFGERWRSSGPEGRREMLVKAGIVMYIKRTPRTNMYTAHLFQPDDDGQGMTADEQWAAIQSGAEGGQGAA